jgi:hypothetical protein
VCVCVCVCVCIVCMSWNRQLELSCACGASIVGLGHIYSDIAARNRQLEQFFPVLPPARLAPMSLYMCPNTTIYMSAHYCMCVLTLLNVCPHSTKYVSSYYYTCVCNRAATELQQLQQSCNMCRHTTIYVSSYYFMCPHSTTYVLILLQ